MSSEKYILYGRLDVIAFLNANYHQRVIFDDERFCDEVKGAEIRRMSERNIF